MTPLIPLALTLSSLACPAQVAAGPAEAAAILDRMQKAFGDAQRIASTKTLTARSRVEVNGGETPAGFCTEVYAGLRRGLVRTELPMLGAYEFGSDGEVVWERSPLGVTIHRGWKADDLIRTFGIALHVDWREMYSRAVPTGVEEVGGRPCHRIELMPKPLSGPGDARDAKDLPWPDVWFVDVDTSLPARIVSKSEGLLGTPELVETDLSDWRDVEGVKQPFAVEIRMALLTLRLAYSSYEYDTELAPDFFDLDPGVRAALDEGEGEETALDVRIEQLEPVHLAAIRVTCDHADIQRTLSIILPEAMRHVTSLGAVTVGPPLVRFHGSGDPLDPLNPLDIEGAIPVAEPIEGKGRVQPAELPGGAAVVVWHVGPYEQLGKTHERIQAYLAEHGLTPAGAPWEEYWTDPGLERDPAKWRTKVVWPVRESGR